jgi:sulfotransferase family protein
MTDLLKHRINPVWLASYPRSGNTFLRILLQNIFQLPSYSVYNLEGKNYADPSAEALENAPLLPQDWRSQISQRSDAETILIKTHGPNEARGCAIYVARDGRAAIDSYYHYHKKYAFEQPSLTEVIAGACQFGSWSEHYLAWRPKTRPNTLFLRYEDLVKKPEEVIGRLAQFLEREPGNGRLPSFEELKARVPTFFRRGDNQDFLAKWTPQQMALFNRLHGAVMQELGYPLAETHGEVTSTEEELARSASRLHRQYMERLTELSATAASQQQLSRDLANLQQEVSKLKTRVVNKDEVLKKRWVRFGLALGILKPERSSNGQ